MSTCLVIPTIREWCLREFLTAWQGKGGWDEIIVIEDMLEPRFDARPLAAAADVPIRHYTHAEIGRILGEDAWIISQRSSACRVFGFLAAWWDGYDAILTLDDDCYPLPGCTDFAAAHLAAITGQPVWIEAIAGMRTRGLPYRNLGRQGTVKVNVGLWTDIPDLDAPCALVNGDGAGYLPPVGSRILPHGQFAPLCGMNVFALREAVPLLYQPPMGQGRPFDRMEDIWGGVILKRICDRLGWQVATGEPFVEHRRASDPFTNLRKEAAGIGANETFWQRIASAPLIGSTDADGFLRLDSIELLEELGHGLAKPSGPSMPEEVESYLGSLGAALLVWCRLLRKRPAGL